MVYCGIIFVIFVVRINFILFNYIYMSFFREFFASLNTESMTKAQQRQRFFLILFAELVITLFMLSLTISDFIKGNKGYDYFSLSLQNEAL